MKAADIPDALFLKAVREESTPIGASLWAIQRRLGTFPEKVVLAKARILLRRKAILGCGCGCRGDFTLLKGGK